MTRWLSAEWFEQTCAMAAGLPGGSGLSAHLQCEVTGGPAGDVAYFWVLEDGVLEAGAPGAVEDPDVTLTSTWEDAMAVHRGDLDLTVAFMQGRMKVAGSMAVMMALLPVTTTPDYRDLRRRIAAVTEF